jgi:hypothetical protein
MAGLNLASAYVRVANRVVDLLLGVDAREILNPGPLQTGLENPAQMLREIANGMRIEAIDAETLEVNYGSLAESESYARFQDFTGALPHCTKEDLGDLDQQTAFWINLYNALILHGIIHYGVSGSMLRDLGFFRRVAYDVGGMRFSADDIEHGVLRGNQPHPYLPFPQFAPDDPRRMMSIPDPDPRVHFALVCGARSCPPISSYDADKLDAQLDRAAASFINGIGVQFEHDSRVLSISRIFRWYQRDFGGREGVLNLLRKHMQDTGHVDNIRLRYLPYDWSVNAVA